MGGQWKPGVHQVCRVDPASMTTATKMHLRERLFISTNHAPFPTTSCIHGDGYSECWKNNEVLRIGTKGFHGAQGFGEMGINLIMLGNLTPGPLVGVVTCLCSPYAMYLIPAGKQIFIIRLLSFDWFTWNIWPPQ